MIKIENYINGKPVAPVSKKYFDVYEPATGKVYAQVPDSDYKDVKKAVAAAQKAFPKWAALSVEERYNYLTKIASLISANLDPLAKAESRDNGKPLWLAKTVDIPTVNGLGSIEKFEVFKTTGLLFSEDKPPYEYFETIDILDMDKFDAEAGSDTMQKIAAKFQNMVQDLVFITTEPL